MITIQATTRFYRKVGCKWCDGEGLCDFRVWQMYQRWLRILQHNKRAGACG